MSEMQREVLRAAAALLAALLTFGGLFLMLKFSPWVSLGLSVGVYAGIFLLLKPIPRIGTVELEELENGEELQRLMEEGRNHLREIREMVLGVSDPSVRHEAQQMSVAGAKLLNYLEKNPQKIVKARRFLTYHLETARNTLSDYLSVTAAQLAGGKIATFREQTKNILRLLTEGFHEQFTQLIEDKLMNTDIQNELLESRIRAQKKVQL